MNCNKKNKMSNTENKVQMSGQIDNQIKGNYTFEVSEIKEDLLTNTKPKFLIDCSLKIEATGKEPQSILTSLFEEMYKIMKKRNMLHES